MTEAIFPRAGAERWAFLALAAVILGLFAAMPAWRGYPPAPVETYATTPAAFEAKVDAMVAAWATGEQVEDGIPVVRPPPGDVYVLARRWAFYPIVELAPGQTYRLHVASVDILHGFHLTDTLDFLLVPGEAHSFAVTPAGGDLLVMQCSEYCGLYHNRMKATIRVLGP